MRVILPVLLALALAGCDLIPRQEITAFTGTYVEVDHAARAIYADYNARKTAKPEASVSNIDPFSPAYITILNDELDGAQAPGSALLATRFAALDAMLAYNDALLGLAEGRRAEEVKAAMAPLALVLGPAVGPLGDGALGAASIVIEAIDAARTREDLRNALALTLTITDSNGLSRTDHPTVLLLAMLEADARDFWIDVRADIEAEFIGIWTSMAGVQTPAGLARAKAVVDEGKAYELTLSRYRALIANARGYLNGLRQAALVQSDVLRSANFAALALQLRADARTLIDRL